MGGLAGVSYRAAWFTAGVEYVVDSFEFSKKIGTRQLPELTSEYESTVSGLYIVGDLADAPVIKIALNQGYDIAEKIAAKSDAKTGDPAILDVAIVGAGPSGVGAALAFRKHGLTYQIIERERAFNTIQNYPKHKSVFAEPRPILAKSGLWFQDALKEELIPQWEKAIDDNQIKIDQPTEVVDIKKSGSVFTLFCKNEKGEKKEYKARRVMLCIGRRGSVRKIGCAGEELDKVAYALGDPDKYTGKNLVIVGGGDSAVESILALCKTNKVTAVHRSEDFSRSPWIGLLPARNLWNQNDIGTPSRLRSTRPTNVYGARVAPEGREQPTS